MQMLHSQRSRWDSDDLSNVPTSIAARCPVESFLATANAIETIETSAAKNPKNLTFLKKLGFCPNQAIAIALDRER